MWSSFLGKLCKEKNYWPFHENQKKSFKQRKVTFKSKRYTIVESYFVKVLSKVFNWHNTDNLSKQFDVCDSDESLDAEGATDCATDFKKFLKSLRTSNPDKLVFAHLMINSIRNKFDQIDALGSD